MRHITFQIEDLEAGLPNASTPVPPTDEPVKPKTRVGRKTKPVEFEITRELVPADIEAISADSQQAPEQLKSLRTRHHKLARLIAEGKHTNAQLALITGYSPARISILKSDPAFKELIASYTEQLNAIYIDAHSKLKDVMIEATEIIQERLEENPDGFTTNQLLDTIKLAADRTGFGPSATLNTNTQITLTDSNKLEELKKLVRNNHNGKINKISQEVIETTHEVITSED